MKQLPLARKENILGHVAKRTWAYSFALCSSVFPSPIFSVVDLWLSLLVQHDMDKGFFYNIAFPEDRCEAISTDENDVVTWIILCKSLRHTFNLKRTDSWLLNLISCVLPTPGVIIFRLNSKTQWQIVACYFTDAIWPPWRLHWRLHTKLYKFGLHTSANNARMKNSSDLIPIIYRIQDSWLS